MPPPGLCSAAVASTVWSGHTFLFAAPRPVGSRNGNHINAWVHLQDIVRGIDFAFGRRLQGIYNLVDDLQFTRRQLSNALCDDYGLPPVIWDNHDRPGARIFNARVSNARLREIGFQPSVGSMLEPVAA